MNRRRPQLAILIAATIVGLVIVWALRRSRGPGAAESPIAPNTKMEQALEWLGSGTTLAPDIPPKQLPDYTVVNFDSVSIKQAKTSWRVMADSARLYNPQNVLHLKNVRAQVFRGESDPTLITAREGKLLTQSDQMELYGDVVATFPDQAQIRSDFMRYFDRQARIEVPMGHEVTGTRADQDTQHRFKSDGLLHDGRHDVTVLPHGVTFTLKRPIAPHTTEVQSDRAVIDGATRTARFTMRPDPKRLVVTRQKDFFMRSRVAEAYLGQRSMGQHSKAQAESAHFLVADEDVYFQEGKDRTTSRYGTCGRAEFDAGANVIHLTKFPQVYENEDTITGDRIRLDREHDVVEVEGSNAYSDRNGTP